VSTKILLATAAVTALLTARSFGQPRSEPPAIELRRGLVITKSVRIIPKVYRFAAPSSLDSAAIIIRGDDVTVDFAGAELEGLDPVADPDRAAGVGLRVDGGHNVRITNASVRGYKVGLLARGTHGLTLDRDDFSYNWKPRLFSLVEHESLADWLSHHHNEADEWLRFGAGAYLAGVHGGAIHDVRIEQGMEGLMLARCDSLRIWNNTLEFNSGVGIGLYRSTDNVIMHNRASYNVRGYSHGFYARGQDSADLLMYEQSSRNVVAYNSMTHGGDGLFLWAGQSTMDTGAGGANDNVFYGNDFSFAPANGMEATFSRNLFVNNHVEGSTYGLWAGYSFDSRILGNDFVRDRTGIAIEHGQGNEIRGNRFLDDSVGVALWANPVEPSDWAYPKHHDTRSRDQVIRQNWFAGGRVGSRIANSAGITIDDNHYVGVDSAIVSDTGSRVAVGSLEKIGVAGASGLGRRWPIADATRDVSAPPPIAGAIDARQSDSLAVRDRAAIIVDDWGPYDWRSPRLWPVDSPRGVPLRLRVLGPSGMWRVLARRGIASLSRQRGRVNDTLVVTPTHGAERDWRLTLEYRGVATLSARGQRRAAGAPYDFSYDRFEPWSSWRAAYFAWSESTDPRTRPRAFAALVNGRPAMERTEPRLDYFWYRPTIAGVPPSKWAVVATTTVSLGSGNYTLRTIGGDAVRAWVDGKLAIDDWTPHDSKVDYAAIGGGRHALRVESYHVDGWVELRVDIVRGVQRSAGSPGPH